MSDNALDESLSALMDGEVTEMELRRVLKQEAGGETDARWRRYQLARAAMRSETPLLQVDVSAAVRAAIAADSPARSAAKVSVGRGPGSRWAGLAVAASVTLAVLGGVRFYNQMQHPDALQGTLALSTPLPAAQQAPATQPPAFARVDAPVVLAGYASGEQQEVRHLVVPAEGYWQLQNLPSYLERHNNHPGAAGHDSGLNHARAASLGGR